MLIKNEALLEAAQENNLAQVEQCLQEGAEVNAQDASGWTALHMAREPKIIEYLLEHGADIEATDKQSRTPLHIAAAKRFSLPVECLIKNGADC